MPWQEAIWSRLCERQAQDRLPHALLFTGPDGVGKRALAMAFIQATLCDRARGANPACGQCNPCRQVLAGSHPDLRIVEPDEEGKTFTLKVDQIRELVRFMVLKSQYGGSRFALIDPADAMNENAAIALLKTLEEPGPDSVLILLSALPGKLPATIRSRCQAVAFPVPEAGLVLPWLRQRSDDLGEQEVELALALAAGAPVRALRMIHPEFRETRRILFTAWLGLVQGRGGVVSAAALWAEQDGQKVLPWLIGWIQDLMRLCADSRANVCNVDLRDTLFALSRILDFKDIAGLLDEAEQALKRTGGSLNLALLYEDLFTSWNGLGRP